MSKAKHALITSAKPTPTRRNALSTGRAACVPSVSQTDALPLLPKGIPPSRDSIDLRRTATLRYAAVTAGGEFTSEMPGCKEAEELVRKRMAQVEAVCKRIQQKPVRTWSDLLDLAEVAYHWAYKNGSDDPAKRAPMQVLSDKQADPFDVASAHLIRAVLSTGGANV